MKRLKDIKRRKKLRKKEEHKRKRQYALLQSSKHTDEELGIQNLSEEEDEEEGKEGSGEEKKEALVDTVERAPSWLTVRTLRKGQEETSSNSKEWWHPSRISGKKKEKKRNPFEKDTF